MRTHWKSVVIGFGGALLALGLWHAYNDHTALHQLINIVNQATAAKQAAQEAR